MGAWQGERRHGATAAPDERPPEEERPEVRQPTPTEAPTAWSMTLQLLGAVTGVIALVTVVGGAMLWIRFDQLHLPADRAVAFLPGELMVAIGAQALAVPILLGLGGVIGVMLIGAPGDKREVPTAFRILVAPILLAMVVAIWATGDLDWDELGIGLAAGALGIVAILKTVWTTTRVRDVAWVVFGVFAVFGATVGIAHVALNPRLEPAAVLMKEGKGEFAGFLVGESSDRLYLVRLPGNGDPGDPFADAAVDRFLALPRAEVDRVEIQEPTGVEVDDPGRAQAYELLEDLRRDATPATTAAPQPVTTIHPEIAFAPLVHLNSRESWYPMSARGFLDNSTLRWRNDDGCEDDTIAVGAALIGGDGQDREKLRDEGLGRKATAYAHPSAMPSCKPARGPTVPLATDHTRPHDTTRLEGLETGEGFYLQLNRKLEKGHRETEHEGPQLFLRNVPVYVEQQQEQVEQQDGLRLTYWFLYGYSQPPPKHGATRLISHQGDWEAVSVLLRKGGQDGEYIPVSVRYNAHNGDRTVPWAVVRKVSDGSEQATHPVAYSALGSHASYALAARYPTAFKVSGRPLVRTADVTVACLECPQWQTWKNVVDVPSQPWFGFGGAWGRATALGETTGPLGPSSYKSKGKGTPTSRIVGGKPALPSRVEPVEAGSEP